MDKQKYEESLKNISESIMLSDIRQNSADVLLGGVYVTL